MDRREFIRRGFGFLAGVAATSIVTRAGKVFAQEKTPPPTQPYDLVAVKNGSPAEMVDKALEALGGMGRFVKEGQTVLVKPNIGWAVGPDRAANTNPAVVKRVIEHCYNAGAKKVYVFDHTCNDPRMCYQESGIERAALDAGATVAPGNLSAHYQKVRIPGASVLKNAEVHELVMESDVFINVPVLKNHGSAKLTVSMKNLMGVVWDRGWWHASGLHECIADFCLYRKPDLNIVDAYAVMMRNGPRGVTVNDVTVMKTLIASPDMVAADAAATKVFGLSVPQVRHIPLAHEKRIGRMDLENLNIKRITLQ